MKMIAVANQKGGVGKTTTVVNLAHYFAMQGVRVLIIDLDAQGHVATCLRMRKGDGVFQLMTDPTPSPSPISKNKSPQEGASRGEGSIQNSGRENLDVVVGDKNTEMVKVWLANQISRELFIANRLAEAGRGYDLVLLDLAPGSDLIHVGALAASDYVLIPARMGLLEHDGVNEVLGTIQALSSAANIEPPVLLGVLPTMFDRVTLETQDSVKRMQRQLGADMILPPIPTDTHVREAIARGMTMWEYAPDSAATIGYVSRGSKAVNFKGRVGGYLHLGEIVGRVI
jgi:chromosome partitioning protein